QQDAEGKLLGLSSSKKARARRQSLGAGRGNLTDCTFLDLDSLLPEAHRVSVHWFVGVLVGGSKSRSEYGATVPCLPPITSLHGSPDFHAALGKTWLDSQDLRNCRYSRPWARQI
ncbi:uncharacterized protein CLUP02_02089, partial [Colletotrichum lupini]